ncbi:terpenoid synthase [Penicillium herquei]|nr:terpenoid synthase [Penicillium herquei]
MESTALAYGDLGKFSDLAKQSSFPQYFRWMTGNAEPFVYAAFPQNPSAGAYEALHLFMRAAPDLCDFSNHVNDLFSFYKDGILFPPHGGYISQRAQTEDISVVECLNRMVDELHATISRIEATLASDPELSKVAMAYIRGYIGFYVTNPRYRIDELTVPSLEAKIK